MQSRRFWIFISLSRYLYMWRVTVAGLWPDDLSLLKYILAVRVTGTDILITVNGKLSQQIKFEDLKINPYCCSSAGQEDTGLPVFLPKPRSVLSLKGPSWAPAVSLCRSFTTDLRARCSGPHYPLFFCALKIAESSWMLWISPLQLWGPALPLLYHVWPF